MLPNGDNGLVGGGALDLSQLRGVTAPAGPVRVDVYATPAMGVGGMDGLPINMRPDDVDAANEAGAGFVFAVTTESDGTAVARYYMIDSNVREHLIKLLIAQLSDSDVAYLSAALAGKVEDNERAGARTPIGDAVDA